MLHTRSMVVHPMCLCLAYIVSLGCPRVMAARNTGLPHRVATTLPGYFGTWPWRRLLPCGRDCLAGEQTLRLHLLAFVLGWLCGCPAYPRSHPAHGKNMLASTRK